MCKKEVTNFHLFKEKSARTEQILLTAFNKPLENKKRKMCLDEPKPQTSTIAIQTMSEHLFSCMECKMIFKTENLLSKHINNKHYATKTDTGCQTDDMSLAEDSYLEEQESIDLENFNYKREMKLEVLEDDIEMDEYVDDAVSEHKGGLVTEYEIVEKVQEEYQCNDCLQTFTRVEFFDNHKCPNITRMVNETSTTDLDELSENYYEELIHEVDLYECYRCHANFANVDEYTVHRNSNECQQFELPFKISSQKTKVDDDHHCNLCHKRFKTSTTFNQHQKLHESIEIVRNCHIFTPMK